MTTDNIGWWGSQIDINTINTLNDFNVFTKIMHEESTIDNNFIISKERDKKLDIETKELEESLEAKQIGQSTLNESHTNGTVLIEDEL